MVLPALLLAAAVQTDARAPATPCAAAARLLPVDQAAMQPDFFTFRARLQAAIARRDEAAVLAAADPGIKTSFGGDEGLETFRTKLRDPQDTVWVDLATALALGGTFGSPDSFTAPYVFAAWPEGADSFECAAVIGDRVRVRTSQSAGSAVVRSVSYDILQRLPDQPESGWTHVRLAHGVTGYISSAFVRSPIDYRAIFQKTNGQWRLRAFVAGD